ncbi:unnamed protein product [Calypogeia fissa]
MSRRRRAGKEYDKRPRWSFIPGVRTCPAGALESDVGSVVAAVMARGRALPFARIAAAEKVMDSSQFVDETRTGNVNDRLSSEDWVGQPSGREFSHAESVSTCRWIEAADKSLKEYRFPGREPDSQLQTVMLKDTRAPLQRVVDGFLNRFFPLGYPDSVSEGYLVYSQYRAVQHCASAILSVLSTQSLLFAAGLRPTPAQATIVSWVLKDGMQHLGKLFCSSLGAQMDSEPKRWRIFADAMYDIGAGLEVISPLCPQHFLSVAGLANMAKGMALVSARATRLPVYSSFAQEGNLSDLYAKGEAISTLSNVLGLGLGIQLASTVCATIQGKLLITPILSAIHLYCVTQEMRAAPINTLNSQRTAFLVADFIQTGQISRPAEVRYRERLILPIKLQPNAGNVRVGTSLVRVVRKPSGLAHLKSQFPEEKFLLQFSDKATDLVLHQSATGEDAVRGWLIAAYAHKFACNTDHPTQKLVNEKGFGLKKESVLKDAYEQTEKVLPPFLEGLRAQGWHTELFLGGSAYRAVW